MSKNGNAGNQSYLLDGMLKKNLVGAKLRLYLFIAFATIAQFQHVCHLNIKIYGMV